MTPIKAGLQGQALPPPAPRGRKYRDFQLDVIRKARKQKRMLMALDMGSGKTIIAIGIINDTPEIRKVLIVCPASLKFNWRIELMRWLVRRSTRIGIATSRQWPLADIVIINYESLKKNHRAIHGTEWDLVILDEAHRVRTASTNQALELFGRESGDPIKRREKLEAPRWLMLTGTPIVNRPMEIFSLVHHLDPESFPSKTLFKNEFCGGKEKGQKKSEIGEKAIKKLHNKLRRTVMVRLTKDQVLSELPPKIRQVIVMPSDRVLGTVKREQREFRKIQKVLSMARLKAELAKAVPDEGVYSRVITELNQHELVARSQISKLRAQTAMAKVPLVVKHALDVLEYTPKLVIFGHHTAVIENIGVEFGEACVIAHGKKSLGDRQLGMKRFQTDPSCRVFIGSMHAVGEGITLTAASTCIFAELDWTPAVLEQCADRLHRMGQLDSVLVQHLVLDGSIDAMLATRVVEKQETIGAIIDDELAPARSLYALSRAEPFIAEDRQQVMDLADKITREKANEIHDLLQQRVQRPKKGMSDLDLMLMKILASYEYLEPSQAALGYYTLVKYGRKA